VARIPVELGHGNGCAGERDKQLLMTDSPSRQRGVRLQETSTCLAVTNI
jgi:hypothetical protein